MDSVSPLEVFHPKASCIRTFMRAVTLYSSRQVGDFIEKAGMSLKVEIRFQRLLASLVFKSLLNNHAPREESRRDKVRRFRKSAVGVQKDQVSENGLQRVNSHMKWDHSTVPPTAWKIEDGDVVMVDPRDVHLCSGCGKWFFKYPSSTRLLCSVGCELRSAENKVKANFESLKDV